MMSDKVRFLNQTLEGQIPFMTICRSNTLNQASLYLPSSHSHIMTKELVISCPIHHLPPVQFSINAIKGQRQTVHP